MNTGDGVCYGGGNEGGKGTGKRSNATAPSASTREEQEVCLRQLSAGLPEGNRLRVVDGGGVQGTRVIATVALGERPWFESLVRPRMLELAERVKADLITVTGERCEAQGVRDFRTCAQGMKVALLAGLLRCYARVMLVDDTALIRG